MKTYFIAYDWLSGFGNIDIKTDKTITNINQIRDIEKGIMEKNKIHGVVITNFILIVDD